MRKAALPLLLLLLFPVAWAEENPSPSKIVFHFQHRFRVEYFNNLTDFDSGPSDENSWLRFRNRFWVDWNPSPRVSVTVGLANEARQYLQPVHRTRGDEIIFETASLEIRDLPFHGTWLKVGRQDIYRGEAFILGEGGVGDGTRSAYFNAAILGLPLGGGSLELMGIWQPPRDRFLPKINNRHKMLVEWEEQAGGAYWTRPLPGKGSAEAYWIFKKEFRCILPVQDPWYQPDRYLHTVGGRIASGSGENFRFAGEWALQRGKEATGASIRAWGGYAWASRRVWGPQGATFKLGTWAYSGDDPSTPAREGWDPLFARHGNPTDIYNNLFDREHGNSYYSNLGVLLAETVVRPKSWLSLRLTYQGLWAFHSQPAGSPGFGTGRFRGHDWQACAEWVLSPRFRGYAAWEALWPGGFYRGKDPVQFFRLELVTQLDIPVDVVQLQ